jgi:type II secretory pathway predicted ATPase ExeA
VLQRTAARDLLHRQIEIMRGMQSRKVVVIVDEAHLLDKEMLEEARFLLNYRMDSENPLALILSGQTELWDKLRLSAYRAILERVDIECFLTPMDFADT